MTPKVTRVEVTADELRKIFNDNRFAEKADSGVLSPKPMWEGHPSPRRSGQPFCTRSQIIAYLDHEGRKAAIVHQYLRPDGTIGGSGKPDPKKLFHQGCLYVLK